MSLTTPLERSRASRARVDDAGVSAVEAVLAIPNGARIFVHGAAATPTPLLEALVARRDLEGVTLYHLHTSGPAPFAAPDVAEEGGKPILALPSTACGGRVSRIGAALKPGAGVVTTRGHVHWVVTEYGAVNLNGLTLRERGEALASIAHPDFRAELRRELAAIRHLTL